MKDADGIHGAPGRRPRQAPTPGKPAGIPLSRALFVRPGFANDGLRLAVDVINLVHDDGDLPTIPVQFGLGTHDPQDVGADARLLFEVRDDGTTIPIAIYVRSNAPNQPFLVLHEVGHLIDGWGLPGRGFASASANVAELHEWRKQVETTRAYRALGSLLNPETGVDPARVLDLIRPDELWARCSAQFVAVRSGNPELRATLDVLRQRRAAQVYHPVQWDGEDFVGGERAIDRLFRRLGWIT